MTQHEAKTRIEKLRREINRHRYLYHVLDRPEISDAALDSLKHELATLEEKFPRFITPDSPTQRVGGKLLPGFRKVRHALPMLSLNDAFSEEELGDWEKRIQKLLPRAKLDYFAEIKVDGFAISLVYENGALKTGSTRGDGRVGEDVTENLKTIESIPLTLHDPSEFQNRSEIRAILAKFPNIRRAIPPRLEVRGEVYMTKPAFAAANREQEKKGLALFANPRNIAAGSVRQLDPKITASRKLDFLAYDIVGELGQRTHEEKHLIAKLFGFKTVDLTQPCPTTAEVVKFWKRVLERRDKLPLLIDGIVVQVNSIERFDQLGVVGKAPRAALAFKFPGEEATTRIRDIIVQVGRTGVLTPVAILEPVAVGGVTVSRATLHNLDEIQRLDARIGDTVITQRAGDVIPDIVRVLKNLRPRRARAFRMPRRFCGQPVIRREGEVAHRIKHPERCELVTREQLHHFVAKGGFDIVGLGPKILDRLLVEGLVRDPADLFRLTETDIRPLERFAEKSAENLIRAIQSRKLVELPRFLYAIGILHVGEETALDLAEQFGTLKGLMDASLEELEAVPNIGAVVAKSIHDWFTHSQNQKLVEKLLRVGVHPKPYKLKTRNYKLKGLTFVLTGGLEGMTRAEAKSRIRERGGDISESVSRETDYAVVGSDPGAKLEKAKKLGVKTISEKEFLRLLR